MHFLFVRTHDAAHLPTNWAADNCTTHCPAFCSTNWTADSIANCSNYKPTHIKPDHYRCVPPVKYTLHCPLVCL